jgi:hypothetical protein
MQKKRVGSSRGVAAAAGGEDDFVNPLASGSAASFEVEDTSNRQTAYSGRGDSVDSAAAESVSHGTDGEANLSADDEVANPTRGTSKLASGAKAVGSGGKMIARKVGNTYEAAKTTVVAGKSAVAKPVTLGANKLSNGVEQANAAFARQFGKGRQGATQVMQVSKKQILVASRKSGCTRCCSACCACAEKATNAILGFIVSAGYLPAHARLCKCLRPLVRRWGCMFSWLLVERSR